jgi:4-amino-4-deoxy-L-arabinose transferase-like glycosyltransferase
VLRASDVHPLGYYALLAVWIRWFGSGLAAARFPSLVLSLASIVLTWRIGRNVFSPVIGLIAAALLALNPFQIIAANEIRMYTLLEWLALCSTWLLWRAASRPAERRWWAAYGASVAAMAYTSYYAFAIIPAQFVWAWLSQPSRRQASANLLVASGVALLCYLPWIPYLLAVPSTGMPRRLPFGFGYLLGLAADQTYGGYLFRAGNYQELDVALPLQYVLPLLAPFVALIGAGVPALLRSRAEAGRLVILTWAGPLGLIILASVALGEIAAYPRQLVFLQPYAALLLAGGIAATWRRLPSTAHVARPLAACLLVAAFGYPAVAQFNPAYQHNRYDLAAEFVQSQYAAGDAVLYFPAGTDMPFHYYFRPAGPEVRVLWQRTRWSREGFEAGIQGAADAVAASGRGRVWLVYSLPWPRGSLYDLVQALRAKHYRPGPSWDFHDVWVTLLTGTGASAR